MGISSEILEEVGELEMLEIALQYCLEHAAEWDF